MQRFAVLLGLCLLMQATRAAPPGAAEDPPPNVVVIMADDLGYGDVGVNGQELIRTPNLDRMAAEGVRLGNFYASAPNCTPSRAGLLTGRYPVRMGLADKVLFAEDRHGLPPEELTIPELLKPLGYATAMVGKWHLGHTPAFWPTRHGFDYFYGLLYSNNQTPLTLFRNTDAIETPVDQSTLTERYTDEVIQFIEAHRARSFFVYVPHTFPHEPVHVSCEFRGRSRAGLYGDAVEALDWSLGRILAALRRLDLEDRTLVIFTSDNGPYPEGDAGGLRGGKGTVWDGGMRVPFVARWPGKIPAGASSTAIAMNIDLLPTIAALTGAPLPRGLVLDGRDISSLLRGSARSPHEVLYFFSDTRIAAVRTQRWKMMVAAPYRGIRRWFADYGLDLLFDMERDPEEHYSLARERPQVWRQMQAHLAQGRAALEPLAETVKPHLAE
jgi:uncharacterized sulfatase